MLVYKFFRIFKAPEFKLYDGANEINVQFNNINQKRTLNQTQYGILKNFNSFVFVKLLRAMSEFNLDESIGGGLFVILNKGTLTYES